MLAQAVTIQEIPEITAAASNDVNKAGSATEIIITSLVKGSFAEKEQALLALRERYGNVTLPVLLDIVNGHLFYSEVDSALYKVVKHNENYLLTKLSNDFLYEEEILVDSRGDFIKLTINNRIRSRLRQVIASIRLSDDSPQIRKAATREILNNLDDESLVLIQQFRDKENNEQVSALMDVALSIGHLKGADETSFKPAIQLLGESIEPAALNSLKSFLETTSDHQLKTSAEKAVKSIEGKRAIFANLETLYFGLSFGSVLVLAGIGLAITFGVMGVINMAHGELIMIGAYTTFVIQQLMPNHIAWSIIVAIPAAFMAAALTGVLMERLVIRHLYGRPLETLLATFGISLILQQAVRSIFSPLNRTVITPDWMSGMLEINSVFSLTWNRLYIIAFCLIVFFSLLMVMKRTSLGLNVRAVAQNRNMARAMGVRSERVDILTFALGSGIAGIAGVALSLLTNVGPNLGQAYIIDSFIVVVFGGVGNLFGTLVAGMSLGIANKVMEPWAGAVLAKILILFFIVLFIQKRPQGLFPQRGRAAEN